MSEYLKKVALANLWMRAYYEEDEPLASDEEYDRSKLNLTRFSHTKNRPHHTK